MNRFWWMGVAALVVMSPAWAEDNASKENLRTITVSGTGEVKVNPDKAVVRLGVTTFNVELKAAKSDADARITRIITLMPKFGIDPKDYQTNHLSISPEYETGEYSERIDKLLGYQVTSGFEITVRKLDELNEFVAAAIEAGATHIYNVDFETTELRKCRDEARKLAIRTARDKATLLAGELDQKISRARVITEGGLVNQRVQGGGGGGGLGGGRFLDAADNDTETETIAAGQISISATVTVVFDLE